MHPHSFAHAFIKRVRQCFVGYAEVEKIGIDEASTPLAKALQYHFSLIGLKNVSPIRQLLEETFAVATAIRVVVKPIKIAFLILRNMCGAKLCYHDHLVHSSYLQNPELTYRRRAFDLSTASWLLSRRSK